ncbi:MAG: hypothetical protein NDJ75_01535, partial [Thermoanaerobaculia bacterium]|nr:hypothetical protein [Thermoanaerobaculia bacterium]
MAALDNLLRGALRAQMEALVLAPGRLPRLRAAGAERDVTQTALDAARIEALTRELAPAGANLDGGAPAAFDYALDGAPLRVAVAPGAGGWTVTIAPA